MSAAECAAGLRAAAAAMAAGQAQTAETGWNALAALPAPALHLLQACTEVLLADTCPFALHFAADLLVKAAVRDWGQLAPGARDQLRAFPIDCVSKRGGVDRLPHAASEMLLRLHAVTEKLHWHQAGAEAAGPATLAALRLCAAADASAAATGAAQARHLLCELSSSRTNLGLSWEQQEELRKAWERGALAACWEAALALLARAQGFSPAQRVQVLRLLGEGLLSWSFGQLPDAGDDGGLETQLLRAGREWAQYLLAPGLAPGLLALHVRGSAEEQHHAQEAFVLLCGTQGPVFAGVPDAPATRRAAWLSAMLGHAAELATRAAAAQQWQHLHAAARACHRLSQAHGVEVWDLLPEFDARVQALCELTVAVARAPQTRGGEEFLVESLDTLLDMWALRLADILSPWKAEELLSDAATVRRHQDTVREACARIFHAFVDAHVRLQPGGGAAPAAGAEDGAHDREYSASTHDLVAMLGRERPDAALAALCGCLTPLLAALQDAAARRAAAPDAVHDALLAAAQVGAAVCADRGEGEVPGIPLPICHAARRMEKLPPDQQLQQCGVLQFVVALMSLCDCLLQLPEQDAAHAAASPLCVAEVLRGLARWARSYLCPDMDANYELSTVFTTSFGEGREAARRIVGYVHRALRALPGDPDVVGAAVEALLAVAAKPALQQWLPTAECAEWGQLCADEAQYAAGSTCLLHLPGASRRRLMEALCVGSGKDLFANLLSPLEQMICEVLRGLHGCAAELPPQLQRGLLLSLDRVRGVVASSVHAAERQHTVASWTAGLLPHLVQIAAQLGGREDVACAVFELFDDLVQSQSAFADPQQVAPLFGSLMQVTKDYAARTAGRRLSVVAAPAAAQRAEEDERLQTLLALTLMLRHVAEWDMLGTSADEGRRVDAGDIVLQGAHYLLSLVDDTFLAHPPLSHSFFALLEASLTLYCDKVALVPDQVLAPLLHSVEWGLRSVQQDVLCAGYKCVAALCQYCRLAAAAPAAARLRQTLPTFLHRTLAAVALEPLPPYAVHPAARAVHALTALLGAEAAAAALQAAVQAHPHGPRLCGSFASCLALCAHADPGGRTSRTALEQWRSAFAAFVATARAVRMQ